MHAYLCNENVDANNTMNSGILKLNKQYWL